MYVWLLMVSYLYITEPTVTTVAVYSTREQCTAQKLYIEGDQKRVVAECRALRLVGE